MKHYLKSDGSIWAFESDGSQDSFVTADMVLMTDAEISAHQNPPLTFDQLLKVFTNAIQSRLDDFAKTRNYDSILSACTYATSSVSRFAADGQYAVNARDTTWAVCYGILASVQSGARSMPTIVEVESELPVLVWPL